VDDPAWRVILRHFVRMNRPYMPCSNHWRHGAISGTIQERIHTTQRPLSGQTRDDR
jgi:hypothetical protein